MPIATGIKRFDALLKGGLPERSVILIEGSPGVGKDVFGYQFLCQGLKDGVGFYAYAEQTNQEVEREFVSYHLDVGQAVKDKRIFWIDASNISSGDNVINCRIDELFTISLALKQVLEGSRGKQVRGLVNILSPALMLNEHIIIYKFMSDLISTLKEYDATTIFLLEQGMHPPEVVTAMEQLCDGVLEMKMVEEGLTISRLLRIKKMRGLPAAPSYHRFELTESGVEILD